MLRRILNVTRLPILSHARLPTRTTSAKPTLLSNGNKRVAAAASEVFIELNGARLTATNEQIVSLFIGIAAGTLSRQDVARFLQEWIAFS